MTWHEVVLPRAWLGDGFCSKVSPLCCFTARTCVPACALPGRSLAGDGAASAGSVHIFRVGSLRDQKTNSGFGLCSVMLHKQGEVWPDVFQRISQEEQSYIIRSDTDSLDASSFFRSPLDFWIYT